MTKRQTAQGIDIHIRIPAPILKQLRTYADKEHRSISSAVLHLTTRMLAVVSAR